MCLNFLTITWTSGNEESASKSNWSHGYGYHCLGKEPGSIWITKKPEYLNGSWMSVMKNWDGG